MTRKWTIAIVLVLTTYPTRSREIADWRWMLGYCGDYEYKLTGDPRFASFLRQNLPAREIPNWGPANQAALKVVGGVPGEFVVRYQRYVVVSGCPAHACVARGMVWADTKNHLLYFVVTANEKENGLSTGVERAQYGIGSADLFLVTSSRATPDHLPDDLRISIAAWLRWEGVLQLNQVMLLTAAGQQPVTLAQLCWNGPCSSIR